MEFIIFLHILLIIITTYIFNLTNKILNIIFSIILIITSIYSIIEITNFDKKSLTEKEYKEIVLYESNNRFFYQIDFNKKIEIIDNEIKNKISKEEYDCLTFKVIEERNKATKCDSKLYDNNLKVFFKNYNLKYNCKENKNSVNCDREGIESSIKNEIDKSINSAIILIAIKILFILFIAGIVVSFINRIFKGLNIKQTYSIIIVLTSISSYLFLKYEFEFLKISLYDLSKINSYYAFTIISIILFISTILIKLNKFYIDIYLLGKEDNVIKFNKDGTEYYVYKIENNQVLGVNNLYDLENKDNYKEIGISDFEDQKISFIEMKRSELIKTIYAIEDKNKENKIEDYGI